MTSRWATASLILALSCIPPTHASDDHDHEHEDAHAEETSERRVHLTREAQDRSGIRSEAAGKRAIEVTLRLYGRVSANQDRVARVVARFPGVLKGVRKRLGDVVVANEVLALVESNESLRVYEVRSAIAGTVIEKHATIGEIAGGEEPLYTIADLSTVWFDLDVYRHDFSQLRLGQRVRVDGGEGLPKGDGVIEYLSPLGSAGAQTMLARGVLPNPEGLWRPGMFVTGSVAIERVEAAVAVRNEALQRLGDAPVVFVHEGDEFEARPVELGRSDGEWTEIVAGLEPGRRYVTEGSFVLKAELGKHGAMHEH